MKRRYEIDTLFEFSFFFSTQEISQSRPKQRSAYGEAILKLRSHKRLSWFMFCWAINSHLCIFEYLFQTGPNCRLQYDSIGMLLHCVCVKAFHGWINYLRRWIFCALMSSVNASFCSIIARTKWIRKNKRKRWVCDVDKHVVFSAPRGGACFTLTSIFSAKNNSTKK